MRLHIGIRTAKQLHDALARQFLHRIHMNTTAIITLARIPLSILIGEQSPLCLHHGARDDVLRCDEFNLFALSLIFGANGIHHGCVCQCFMKEIVRHGTLLE